MIAPCLECSHRSVVPNCHADCEQYLLYVKYRQNIRDARQREHEANTARIEGAARIRSEVWRRKRNG